MKVFRKILISFLFFGIMSAGFLFLNLINLPVPVKKIVNQKQSFTPLTELTAPILIYHHIREFRPTDAKVDRTFIIPPAEFKRQMDYLKENNFTAITLQEFKDIFDGKKSAPAKPVIITFDDGIKSQFENAWPILKANNQKAVFFIFTNPIGRSKNYFSWEDLKELKNFGMEIGSHGHYHSNLSKLQTPQEWEREINKNCELIKTNLGEYPVSEAYPFGGKNEEAIEKIKQAGYILGRGIANGKIHTPQDFFNLHAYFPTDDFKRFKWIVD